MIGPKEQNSSEFLNALKVKVESEPVDFIGISMLRTRHWCSLRQRLCAQKPEALHFAFR